MNSQRDRPSTLIYHELTHKVPLASPPPFVCVAHRWSYIYGGDDVPSGANDVDYMNDNATLELIWALYKPSNGELTSGIDAIYAGFTNAKFLGYEGGLPLGAYYQRDANYSCPGVPRFCCETYKNASATDQETGHVIGDPTLLEEFDTRVRPWYKDSMARGDIWSQPYPFTSNSQQLGISAARQIITASGKLLGVFGVDYELATLDNSITVDDPDFLVFIVDLDGVLIASSAPGASVDSSNNRVVAVNSSNPTIASVTYTILKDKTNGGGGGWMSASDTIVVAPVPGGELAWAHSHIIQSYGLIWSVVVVQVVRCDPGYFVPRHRVYDHKLASFTAGSECHACPEGAVCRGGVALPFPKPGFWVDRRSMTWSGHFYPCVWDTCTGFRVEKKPDALRCWEENDYNSSLCIESELECTWGSEGPLCGHCSPKYTFYIATRSCVSCNDAHHTYPLLTFAALVCMTTVVLVLMYSSTFAGACFIYTVECLYSLWKRVVLWPPLNVLQHIDSGQLKILWATGQIVSTISFSLRITFPEPFQGSMISQLSYLQMDFVPMRCYMPETNFLTLVLMMSLVPIGLVVLDALAYFLRLLQALTDTEARDVFNQHAYFAILLSYLVLPVVSMVQFSSLDCVNLADGSSYLRADTSVDCNMDYYREFVALNSLLITAYQSVPLIWLALLWKSRHKINFSQKSKTLALRGSLQSGRDALYLSQSKRTGDPTIMHSAFLWSEYRPSRW